MKDEIIDIECGYAKNNDDIENHTNHFTKKSSKAWKTSVIITISLICFITLYYHDDKNIVFLIHSFQKNNNNNHNEVSGDIIITTTSSEVHSNEIHNLMTITNTKIDTEKEDETNNLFWDEREQQYLDDREEKQTKQDHGIDSGDINNKGLLFWDEREQSYLDSLEEIEREEKSIVNEQKINNINSELYWDEVEQAYLDELELTSSKDNEGEWEERNNSELSVNA